MIDPDAYSQRQMELAEEFAKYVIEHPEIDDILPEDSYVYFQIDTEPEFNQYSLQLARRRDREEGMIPVCVRLKGLTPRQGSRLIDPEILTSPTVA